MRMGSARGSTGRNTVVALFIIAALLQSANAATLTVGGITGWIAPGNFGLSSTFYDDWAKSQIFSVGDILDFVYRIDFHNVFEVTAADLASCNLNSPLNTYETSGGASVPISSAGNHYYICGVPGHCLANMQMSIVVPAAAKAPSSTPVFPEPSTSPVAAPAPAPRTSKGHQSAAPTMIVGVLCVVTSFYSREFFR